VPLLMIGGAYLCYEGVEKLVHKFTHHDAHGEEEHHAKEVAALSDASIDLVALEKDKIKGAVRTDFILSAEILVITLGSVAGAPFARQVAVMLVIAIIMTVGVYGLVACIVKLDDVGLHLSQRGGPAGAAGRAIVGAAPWLMKLLSIVGTAAMFLVGGGIVTHGVEVVHHTIEEAAHWGHEVPGVGVVVEALIPMLLNGLAGIVVGAVILGVVEGGKRLLGRT
jgi:predicted DNA repair protein MutK